MSNPWDLETLALFGTLMQDAQQKRLEQTNALAESFCNYFNMFEGKRRYTDVVAFVACWAKCPVASDIEEFLDFMVTEGLLLYSETDEDSFYELTAKGIIEVAKNIKEMKGNQND